MRVLIEYKNKRVDIKTPISMRQKIEETPEALAQLINESLNAFGLKAKQKNAPIDVVTRRPNEGAK